ncbi:hypothetical protein RvY_11022 [Ramazzottius varieornatus]|uniref:Prominin-1-A-like n=1 Tax=Ramazzottius varieornatus TaxID=947166 RepID=A0A1D1VGT2_RAMVA|nr:hypothetical protein RvY_11022 [Ramazzottius varieornatus]
MGPSRGLLTILLAIALAHLDGSSGQSPLSKRDERSIETVTVNFPKYNSSGNRNVSLEEFQRPSAINFWYAGQRFFMDMVQPRKPSIEFVVQMINETSSQNKATDATFVWSWLRKTEVVGVFALVIIGLLFVFGTVLGGVIFCLCQCCSRSYQKHDESGAKCSRFTLSFFICLCCFAICFGIGMFATSLSDLHHSATTLPDMVDASFHQINLMLTTTESEVNTTIRDGYHLSKELIIVDLKNADTFLSGELYTVFEELKANETLQKVVDIGDDLLDVIHTLESSNIQAKLDNFTGSLANISVELAALTEDLRALCESLSNNVSPVSCSSFAVEPDNLSLDQHENLTLQLNVEDTIRQLKEVQQGWHGAEAYSQYQSIPSRIAQEVAGVTSGMVEALKPVDDGIDKLMDLIGDGISSLNQYIQPYQHDVIEAISYPLQYAQYITGVSIGVSLFFALLVSLTVLGCCAGGITYRNKVLPPDRSGVVRVGGCFMMTTVYLGLLLWWLFMLLTTVLFVGGSQTDSTICPILRGSQDNFSALHQLIGELTKANPASLNGSITIHSVPSLLSSCRDGATIYTALDLASRESNNALRLVTVNIGGDLNLTIGGMQGPLSNLTFFSNSSEEKLRQALKVLDKVDLGSLLSELDPSSRPINQTDFGLVEGNLLALAQSLGTPGPADKRDEVVQLAQRLHSFNTRLIEEIELQRRELHAEVVKLDASVRQFASDTNDTLDAALHLQSFAYAQLTDDAGVLQKSLSDFAIRLSDYVVQFVQHILDTVKDDLGGCRPVYDVYDTASSFICLHAISALNGVWFALGLILMSLLVLMFLNCFLSSYYSRAGRTNVRMESESLQPVQRLNITDRVNYAYQ